MAGRPTLALVAGLLTLLSCADAASVGRNRCPRDWNCDHPAIDVHTALSHAEISTGSRPALKPTWTAADELDLPGLQSGLDAPLYPAQLADAGDGRLWLFAGGTDGLSALVLAADGRVLAAQQLPSPSDVAVEPLEGRTTLRLGRPTDHVQGPVLPLFWPSKCSNVSQGTQPNVAEVVAPTSSTQEPESLCRMAELIVFGKDPLETPTRIPTWRGGLPTPTTPVYRTGSGATLIVPALPTRVHEIDLTGRELWASEPLAQAVGSRRYGRAWAPDGQQVERGALLSNGSLVLALEATADNRDGWQMQSLGLLRIGPQGALSLQSIEPAEQFRTGALHAVAVDLHGRLLVPLPLREGHVLLMRIAPEQVESYALLREDYTDLHVDLTAIDAAGTFYLTTPAGGRAVEAQHPLLCRLAMEGQPDCFALAARPFSMAAPAPGVIYTLSVQGLARYDLPPF